MKRHERSYQGVVPLLGLLLLSACQQKMASDGNLPPFGPNDKFPDALSARQPVAGTVARGQLQLDDAVYKGKVNGAEVTQIPVPVNETLLRRGRERYNIHCAPCHSETGDGQGMIVQRGFLAPPTYHQDRLRLAPAGHFFDVITHGYGAMYSYADRIATPDRWAIVAYVRALQKSQDTPVAELNSDDRNKLGRTGP